MMKNRRVLILLDNGSSRTRSTLSLRRIAATLGERIGETVHPVSLMHADKVPANLLDGRPAHTFEAFLRGRAAEGEREFLVLPLFFGPSRALTEFVPDRVEALSAEFGPLDLEMADVLCPLPGGEPRLAAILQDNIARCAFDRQITPTRVVLVDHGSPIPEVTAVRRSLARDLRNRLGAEIQLDEAVMERREGAAYDFNGDLLEDILRRLAAEDSDGPIILSMLFLFAGRHAGSGGDVERIYRAAERENPGFRVHPSPLVGAHAGIVDVLQSRLEAASSRRQPFATAVSLR